MGFLMNFSYGYLSINIISLLFIIAGLISVVSIKSKKGSNELLIVMALILIGSFSIFMESLFSGYEKKLLWRNISQIGLFILPSGSYNFIMIYTRNKNRILGFLRCTNFIFSAFCVLLIFTNDFHHVMRISVDLVTNDGIPILKVSQTLLGKICVVINTLMSITAMIKLWFFLRSTSPNSRTQVRLVLIGFLIPIIFTYTRSAILTALGVFIPTPLSFMIGLFFILLGIYRYDLLALSPIARDWVIDEINIGMIFTNPDGEIVDINRYMLEIFNNSKDSVKLLMESNTGWKNAIQQNIENKLEVEWNCGFTRRIFLVRVHDLKKRNRSLGTVSLLTDITDDKLARENLIRRAETDSMTKILNRDSFRNKVSKMINENQDEGKYCSLFILDIDNFKLINDTYGHMTGDEVIWEVVRIINSTSRQNDFVGRLGGDEFIMFLFDSDKIICSMIAERINKSIENHEFRSEKRHFHTSLSIGIVNTVMMNLKFEELYDKADQALLEAKNQGKNKYSFY